MKGTHTFGFTHPLTLPEHTHDSHFARDTGLPLVTFVQSAKRQAWSRGESWLGRITLLCGFS